MTAGYHGLRARGQSCAPSATAPTTLAIARLLPIAEELHPGHRPGARVPLAPVFEIGLVGRLTDHQPRRLAQETQEAGHAGSPCDGSVSCTSGALLRRAAIQLRTVKNSSERTTARNTAQSAAST